jgi:uncharacterized protein involved in exopolysaccharide biosynthesis
MKSSELNHPLISQDRSAEADEISLAEIAGTLWGRRYLILLITLVFGVCAAIYSLLLPVKFESSVLLAPISDEGDSGKFAGVSSLVSQYGGLSALGGFNFSSSNRKSEATATLQSRTLTETYIAEKNLLPILFAKSWDADNNRWKATDPKKIPTLWQANEFFDKSIRKLTEDKKTGLLTLTITWSDPNLAAEWANDLVARTNQYLRQRASEQSNRNIAYLNDQLTRTSVVELQRAIYGLIEAEIKKVMVAQGSDEYAFKVIDPAAVPERKSGPKRTLITVIGLFAGLILSLVLALALPRKTD